MSELVSSSGALATTIGPLQPAPHTAALAELDRERIAAWRERCWCELRRRSGADAASPAELYEHLAFERWRGGDAGGALPPRTLDLFYRIKRLIPRALQLALRRRLIRRQGVPQFPGWPYEPAGAELLHLAIADELLRRGVSELRFPWFWPAGARAAVALTHDVESADGIARAATVAGWEEAHGFRSSFNIVSDWYPLDMERLHELAGRGHELGSHALHHDRSLFASREAFEQRLPLLAQAARQLNAVGFRSPATHRVVDWLGELPFAYDCTMPHSDPYEPIPGGTATVWPFFHGDVVELPYSAPQDHTLYNLLGHTDAALWRGQFERVLAGGGLFQVLTHPDGEYLGQPRTGGAYRELLATIATHPEVWVALPREIAEWWRQRRDGLTPRSDGIARWTGSEIVLIAAEPRGG